MRRSAPDPRGLSCFGIGGSGRHSILPERWRCLTGLVAICCWVVVSAATFAAGRPHAWQIDDVDQSLGGSGNVLFFTNALTAPQRFAATNSGWKFTVLSRLVRPSPDGITAQYFNYGHGDRRFAVGLDADVDGNLVLFVQQVAGGFTMRLTLNGRGTNDYHLHEMVYRPDDGQVHYSLDGVEVTSWSNSAGEPAAWNGVVLWGANASMGRGAMNYHSVRFEIVGLGTVAEYQAGFESDGPSPLDPTLVGWGRTSPANPTAVTETPVSADPYLPEIAISTTLIPDLNDGSSNVFFDPQEVGTTSAPTLFSIRNAGTFPLDLGRVSLAWGDVDQFSINTGFLASIVPPGLSTSFTATFSPTSSGRKTAMVQVVSSDDNEGTFHIPLWGDGVILAALARIDASPSNQGTVRWTSQFSIPVTGLTAGNFVLSGAASAGATIGVPTTSNGGLVWEVPVTTGPLDGELMLSLDNYNGLSPFPATLPPVQGQPYTMDKTPPTVSIGAPSTAAAGTVPVTYTVTFSGNDEFTSGLSPSDITLNTTGTATATVAVNGDRGVFAVSLRQVRGTGTLGISVAPGRAVDAVGNLAGGAGPSATFDVTGQALRTLEAYLKGPNSQGSDAFGAAVALDGDTLVIGAPGERGSRQGVNPPDDDFNVSSGAVYVFVRDGSTWGLQAYLKASNAGDGDSFGGAVAIDGDTLVVGADFEDGSGAGVNPADDDLAEGAGAAYVFVRSGTNWSQQAYLKSATVQAFDRFGCSVGVVGNTVVVGARGDNGSGAGINWPDDNGTESGAAYVFVRNGTTWSQEAYLKPSNPDAFDNFGTSVAIDGNTVVVGANFESGSGTGVNPGNDNLASRAGAAYVFIRSGVTWRQQAYLKASNTGVDDLFGTAVDIDGDTLVVSAFWEDGSGRGVNPPSDDAALNAGAAYVFVRSGTNWSQQAYLKASNAGPENYFGRAVDVQGDLLVVSAPYEEGSGVGVDPVVDDLADDSGAAYVFVRQGTNWSPQAYLKASNTDALDLFGVAAALDGGTVVVGASSEAGSGNGVHPVDDDDAPVAGAAYLYQGFGLFPEISVEVTPAVELIDGVPGIPLPAVEWVDGLSAVAFEDRQVLTASASATVTIRNQGTLPLALANVAWGGGDVSEFSFDTGVIPASIPAGGSWSFPVAFTPTGEGPKTARLLVISNDADEGTFDIDLVGTGTAAVILLDRVDASPSNQATVHWTLWFTSPVGGLTADFLVLSGSAAAGATIGVPTTGNGGFTWEVPVTTGAIDGDLTLSLDHSDGLIPGIGNPLPFAGQTYVIDRTPPSLSIGNPSVASAGSVPVTFTLTYADANLDETFLTEADITLNATGTATGTVTVNGGGSSYTVTITGISGTGTLGIGVAPDRAIDRAGNLAGGAGPSATFDVVDAPLRALEAYLKASNTGTGDQFGFAVALDGDTAVVGAVHESGSGRGVNPPDDEDAPLSGAAYVYVRNGNTWSRQAYLKPSNTGAFDRFGTSVAIQGNTIVVGARFEDGSGTGVNPPDDDGLADSGAAYVFVRNGTTWTQEAYLKASNPGSLDEFGASVAISGETVVVGSRLEDGGGTGIDPAIDEAAPDSGAAYVFVRSGTTWVQQAYLKASNTGAGDWFGVSVAAGGDTVVVGAGNEDGGGVGVNPPDGDAVADSGAAYVFVRRGTSWTQQAYLKALNAGINDRFGSSVALDGSTLVAGAYGEDGAGIGVDPTDADTAGEAGAAYVFVRDGESWSQQSRLKASNTGAGDLFGFSVSVSGDIVVVGARDEDGGGIGVDPTGDESVSNAGAAYVFVRQGTNWSHQAYLKSLAPGVDDWFGHSVAVSRGRVIVGSPHEDGGGIGVNPAVTEAATESGSAYVFAGLGLPEIVVEQPHSTPRFVGNTIDFGFAFTDPPIGSPFLPKVFSVLNSGTVPLTLSSVGTSGGDAADFDVEPPLLPIRIPVGGFTTFVVTFRPTFNGPKSTTLRVVSDDVDEASFDLTLAGVGISRRPTLDAILDPPAILEDAGLQTVNLAGIRSTWRELEQSGTLTVTATSDNPGLIPNPSVTYTSAEATGSLSYVPVADASGRAVITVEVREEDVTFERQFTVMVTPVNDPPTLAPIGDPPATLEDSPPQIIPLSGIGSGGENQSLRVTATSDHPGLIPDPVVEYTSPEATGSLTVAAAPNASGSARITVRVTDDGGTSDGGSDFFERTFTVIVAGLNDPPTLDAIPDLDAVPEDSGPREVTLTGLSAGAGESQVLTLTARTDRPDLIGDLAVGLSGSETTAILRFTPAADATGTARITVQVKDDGGTFFGGVDVFERSFAVTIVPVNDPPTLAAIPDPDEIPEDAGTQTIDLSGIGAGPGETQALTVTATSGNPGLVPNPTVTYRSPESTATLSYAPLPQASGTALITVRVSDDGGTERGGVDRFERTFTVRVGAENDAPNLAPILDQRTLVDRETPPIPLQVGDIDPGDLDRLVLRGISGDTNLVSSDDGFEFGGTGVDRTLVVRPLPGRFGTVTNTIEVRDAAGSTARRAFVLEVVSGPRIVVQPVSWTSAVGAQATLDVVAEGTEALVYQWLNGERPVSEGTGSRLTLANAGEADSGDYRVVITNDWGAVTSRVARLSIVRPASPPRITQQPEDQRVTPGATLRLEIRADVDDSAAFRWRRNGVNLVDGDGTGTNDPRLLRRGTVAGATTRVLTITGFQPADGGAYRVAVQNQHGVTESREILVLPEVPNGVLAPSRETAGARLLTGEQGILRASTMESGVDQGWISWRAPAGGIARFTTAGSTFDTRLEVLHEEEWVAADEDRGGFLTSYAAFNTVRGRDYRLAIGNGFGVRGGVVVSWWFEPGTEIPVIERQPAGVVVPEGGGAVLEVGVQATSMPLGFQWFRNEQPIDDAEGYVGTRGPRLEIPRVEVRHLGVYTVVVASADDPTRAVTSAPAIVEERRGLASEIPSEYKPELLIEAILARRNAGAGQGLASPRRTAGLHAVSSVSAGTIISDTFRGTGQGGQEQTVVLGGSTRWYHLNITNDALVTARTRITKDGVAVDSVIQIEEVILTGENTYRTNTIAVGDTAGAPESGARARFLAVSTNIYFGGADGYDGASGTLELSWRADTSFVAPAEGQLAGFVLTPQSNGFAVITNLPSLGIGSIDFVLETVVPDDPFNWRSYRRVPFVTRTGTNPKATQVAFRAKGGVPYLVLVTPDPPDAAPLALDFAERTDGETRVRLEQGFGDRPRVMHLQWDDPELILESAETLDGDWLGVGEPGQTGASVIVDPRSSVRLFRLVPAPPSP